MNHRLVLAAGSLALLAACGTIPHPREADALRDAPRWPGTTVATLEADRQRYVAKCSSCHMLRKPSKYNEEKWTRYLDKMGDRAKLTVDDREAILRYLVTIASRPSP